MGRFLSYGQKDTPWTQDGDAGFKGTNMLLDRSQLPPGYLARCENKRLRDGVAATRSGTSFPTDFNPEFENTILGSAIFNNPNGAQVMLVATLNADYVWALEYGKDPVQIDLDAGQVTGVEPLGLVQFVQAFEKVLMLRFPIGAQPPLVWTGVNTDTFDPVTLVSPGLNLIPTTIMGIPHKNRVVLYSPYIAALPYRDQVIITDINNYSSYDNVYGDIRVNAGESDVVTCVIPYFKDSLIVFKKHSVHMLENFTQPLADGNGSGDQRMLTNQLGGVSIRLPLIVGTDVLFASEPGGFYRVSELIQEQIATQPVPISRRIQPIIDQIDWGRMAFWGCSALLGDYAYFGITRHGHEASGAVAGCDAVLVYNTVSNEWESAPDWRDDNQFLINAMHIATYNGAQRLFGLDYASSRIYLMDEGVEDEVSGDIRPIHDVIETRGYVSGDPGGFKRCERTVIGIRSFNPHAEVTALSDGFNEEKHLATITKDRIKNYVWGVADFNPGTDDPNLPKRKDYSGAADITEFICEDFENLPVGGIDFLPPLGSSTANLIKQQSLERMSVRQNGRWVSIRVENTQGQCDVLGVGVDSIPAQESFKVVA